MVPLTTAAGPWSCDSSFHYRNKDSGATVDALILPDTPAVLSMGILVIRDKWHFEWPAGSYAPFAVKPDGSIVWFIVRDYVLFLQKTRDVTAMAAVTSIVAVAKRKVTSTGPPVEDEDPVVPPEGGEPLPPPPPAPDGADDLEARRAARRRHLYDEAKSVRHLLTHTPANPYCKACMFGKPRRVSHRKGAMGRHRSRPTEEGHLLILDWLIL